MASAVTIFPAIEFADKLWIAFISLLFRDSPVASVMPAERVSRHDIRISPVRQNCAPLGLAVTQSSPARIGSAPGMTSPHPVGHGAVIDAVIHLPAKVASDGNLPSPFAEPFDIVFVESNYIGTADKSRGRPSTISIRYHES